MTNQSEINTIFDKMEDVMINLAMRWMDEREYEDIADYQSCLEKYLPEGVSIIKMSRRPFGFYTMVGGKRVLFACTSRKYYWEVK